MSTRDRSISLVLVLLLGACFGLHLITDPDVFLHAAAGRALLADFSTLGMASFHDAAPAKPYVADKWVSQIATAILAAQGESALMLLQIALATFVAFAWWRMFVAHGAGAWVASGAVALAL
ncbi:MAG: hypothetical protein HC882_08910, partial [Acidobacteria bacterium]|nr:hypothetical protein [Acidobacteriota bacterium]